MSQSGISSLFYIHGKLCSYHPVEVLLVCITGTVCLLTLNIYDATHFASQQSESSGQKVSEFCFFVKRKSIFASIGLLFTS